MKIKGHTLGAWFNRRRFEQRRAKGYALSKRFDRRLSRWLNGLLFRLLPPEWYLRTQGIKLRREPPAAATVTYRLRGETKAVRLEFGSAKMIVVSSPLWLKCGFVEPATEGEERHYISPHNILEIAWYDPVLEDYFSMS